MFIAIDFAYLIAKNTAYYTGSSLYAAYRYFYPSAEELANQRKSEELHQMKEDLHELKEIMCRNTDEKCIEKRIYNGNDRNRNIICPICNNLLMKLGDDSSKFKDCSLIYYDGEMKPAHMYCARKVIN